MSSILAADPGLSPNALSQSLARLVGLWSLTATPRCWPMRPSEFRLLRPNGQLALSVWCPIEDQPIYLQVRAVLARYVGKEVAAPFFSAPNKIGGPDNLRRLLEDAGFVDVSVRRQDFSVELVSAADFLVRYGTQSVLVELLPPLGEERCRSALRDLLARLSNNSPDLPFTPAMPFYLATAGVDTMIPHG